MFVLLHGDHIYDQVIYRRWQWDNTPVLCRLHSPLQVLFPHILASRTPYPDNITIHSKSEKVCGTAFCRIVGVAILAFRMYDPGVSGVLSMGPGVSMSLPPYKTFLKLC